jgi:hypothetical protein
MLTGGEITESAIKTKLSRAGVHLKGGWKIYAASTKSQKMLERNS